MPVIRNGARRSIVRGGRRHCDDQRTEQQRPCTSSRGRRSPGLQSPSIHLDQPQLGMRNMPMRSTPSAHADTDSLGSITVEACRDGLGVDRSGVHQHPLRGHRRGRKMQCRATGSRRHPEPIRGHRYRSARRHARQTPGRRRRQNSHRQRERRRHAPPKPDPRDHPCRHATHGRCPLRATTTPELWSISGARNDGTASLNANQARLAEVRLDAQSGDRLPQTTMTRP